MADRELGPTDWSTCPGSPRGCEDRIKVGSPTAPGSSRVTTTCHLHRWQQFELILRLEFPACTRCSLSADIKVGMEIQTLKFSQDLICCLPVPLVPLTTDLDNVHPPGPSKGQGDSWEFGSSLHRGTKCSCGLHKQ